MPKLSVFMADVCRRKYNICDPHDGQIFDNRVPNFYWLHKHCYVTFSQT